jgi:hypothetical protein
MDARKPPDYQEMAQTNLDRTLKLLKARTAKKQGEPHDES